jgi:type IV pilus modification protein PilV
MGIYQKQTASQVRNGFTLVEVLVATAILAIGLLAAATMVSRSTVQDARAYYTTRASLMVEEFLENLTRLQYNANDYKGMAGAVWNTTVDGVVYNTVCVLANNTPMENCKEMTCTITWNNKGLQASTQYVYAYAQKY